MSYSKIADLVQKIYTKSNDGTIEWEGTEQEGTYQVSFSSFTIRMFPKDSDYILQIINSNGELVEEVNDENLKGLLENPYNKMKSTHEIARRQVMGVESALDSILGELDGVIPF